MRIWARRGVGAVLGAGIGGILGGASSFALWFWWGEPAGRVIGMQGVFSAMATFGVLGMVLADRWHRRRWEKGIVSRLDTLSRGQDTLARDVARGQIDLIALKRKITASAGASVSQSSSPSPSPSAKKTVAPNANDSRKPAADRNKARSDAGLIDFPSLAPHVAQPVQWREAGMSEEEFSDTVVLELLRDSLDRGRVDMFVQPVLRVPQRRIIGYEILGRLRARPGVSIPAARFLKLARAEGLGAGLDKILLCRTLELLRRTRHDPARPCCFLNIDAGSLEDRAFMADLLGFLEAHRDLADRLVLERPQDSLPALSTRFLPVVQGLARIGCQFSIDHVQSGKFMPALLRAQGIRFIRMDAARVLADVKNRPDPAPVISALRALESSGFGVIIEKIETEQDFREILDCGISRAQGYLFGKPDFYASYIRPAA